MSSFSGIDGKLIIPTGKYANQQPAPNWERNNQQKGYATQSNQGIGVDSSAYSQPRLEQSTIPSAELLNHRTTTMSDEPNNQRTPVHGNRVNTSLHFKGQAQQVDTPQVWEASPAQSQFQTSQLATHATGQDLFINPQFQQSQVAIPVMLYPPAAYIGVATDSSSPATNQVMQPVSWQPVPSNERPTYATTPNGAFATMPSAPKPNDSDIMPPPEHDGRGIKRKTTQPPRVNVCEKILSNIRTKKTLPAVEGVPLFGANRQQRGGRPKGKGSSRTPEQRKAHRKELNRRNAFKSRLRKKFNVEEKIIELAALQEENARLKKKVSEQVKPGASTTELLLRDAKLTQLENHFPEIGEKALSVHETHNLNSHIKGKHGDIAMVMTKPGPDGKQVLHFATPAFYELVQYSPEEVIGKPMSMLQGVHTNPATVQVISDVIAKHQPVHAKVLNYRKDGTPFWVELQIAPLQGNSAERTGWIGVLKRIDVEALAVEHGIDLNIDIENFDLMLPEDYTEEYEYSSGSGRSYDIKEDSSGMY